MSAAASAQAPTVTLLAVPEDGSVINIRPAAELLIRHGAPVTLAVLPIGRIESIMKEPIPVCGMSFIRNLHDRPDFQWIARTAASFDFVAASLTGGDHPPGPETTAIAALNTLSQTVAIQAGYTVLPVKSLDLAVPLLRSGRAAVLVAAGQEVEKISAADKTPLHVERLLARGEAWMACNPLVERRDVERIADAWNQIQANGELREFYAKAGVPSLYPEP